MSDSQYIEAQITGGKELTGREWDVTIIGPKTPNHLIKTDGREFILSTNGRLYSADALEGSAPLWEGVKVYDNHLTNEEYERRQGMRSVKTEWLGNIVNVYYDKASRSLKGVFKVVEEELARKLKKAYDQGVLSFIGLSIDSFTQMGKEINHEGNLLPVIESFKKIVSVDLVGEPAAGGGFNRILAAHTAMENKNMDEEIQEQKYVTVDTIGDIVSKAVADAFAAQALETPVVDVDDMADDEVLEAYDEVNKKKVDLKVAEAQVQLQKLQRAAESEQQKVARARMELMVDRKLEKARLPEKFEASVRAQFKDRVVEGAVVDEAISLAREAYASLDPTGRVKTGGIGDIRVGVEQDERFELALWERIMGISDFRALEHNKDQSVRDLLSSNPAYKSWVNAGKPPLARYNRLSNLLNDYFGGDLLLDGRLIETATTSTLATAVKNTVNIMAANIYSQRELWFERVARVMEVDTIDDATLARVYGVDTLDVVPEGAAYTELELADEEETASFVKRGNYIEVSIETMLRDKIGAIQRIPQVLADTWYNTQSDLVANVFTVNSAAGPVLADSGALFNATAVSTAGGHANLLTTALSHSQYGVVRTAMRKQTDQPLGAGRKLMIKPRYLLVPVDLEVAALEIRDSELEPGADFDAAGGGAQTRNLYAGEFDVIMVPSWTDATNWAAVADPMVYPAIWLIYPRGMRTPQVFTADSQNSGSMFTNDTLRFKTRLMTYRFSATYDCAPVSDFRPLFMNIVAG